MHKGDMLRVNTTYDSKPASWYESMGIMIVWATDGTGGPIRSPPRSTRRASSRTVTCPRTTTTGAEGHAARRHRFAPTVVPVGIDNFIYGAVT